MHTPFVVFQEQLIAELLANPLPSPPEPESVADVQASAIPPHVVDGSVITIHDLMVGADPLKDQKLTEWLDAREKLGFEKMAETVATGQPNVDPETVRTLAKRFTADKSQSKLCCGNAITRSCAFTGSFVILKCGRRVLYPQCPGLCGTLVASKMCLTHSCLFCRQDGRKPSIPWACAPTQQTTS